MPIGLLALALGGFGIGLTEFGIIGLLPQVASSFGVSSSVAGYLVTGYALSVAVGAVVLTALIGRLDRKKVLLALMVLFIAGNLVSAVAPDYGVLLLGRIVAALCHGAFFGVGAVVAADMVPPSKKAGAISLMFAGLTVANVLGVPLGTFAGQHFGWRATFWGITVIGLITMLCILALVPATPAPEGASLGGELGALRRGQVWVSASVTALAYGGMFGGFTYIAFTLTRVGGFSSSTVPWLLVLFGVGTFIGNFAGGKAADRSLNTSLIVIIALLTAVLVLFALSAHSKALTIPLLLLTGAVGLATAPGLQLRTMHYAQDAPTMASGVNIAAFNLGNALGAWVCGLPLSAGFSYVAPFWVGAAMTAAGLLVLLAGTVSAGRAAGLTLPGAGAEAQPAAEVAR